MSTPSRSAGGSDRHAQDRAVHEAVRQALLAVRNDKSMQVAGADTAPWGGISDLPTTLAGYGVAAEVNALDAAVLAAAEDYADDGDIAVLAAAENYADVGDAATLVAANAYTDAAVLTLGSHRATRAFAFFT